jgi:hypothetical protein
MKLPKRIKFRRYRRYSNKLCQRFRVVRAQRQDRKILPQILREGGL